MQEKIIFREMLGEIKELADQKLGRLTSEEVKEFFKNAHLDENQMELIYNYLAGQKIIVDGYANKGNVNSGDESSNESAQDTPNISNQDEIQDDDYVKMYLADIEGVVPADASEEERLYGQAARGDSLAKGRLIELNLKTVYNISKKYSRGALPQSDLIQEGNIALMLALDEMDAMGSLEEYRQYVKKSAAEAMESALKEQENAKDMDEQIAQSVNLLRQAVENLTLDLERKVGIEELSAYLEMPVGQIKDLLRMAGDEIEVEGCKTQQNGCSSGHDHHSRVHRKKGSGEES